MRKKSREGLVSSQRSIWFYSDSIKGDPRLDKKSAYYRITETIMLIDDVKSSCMPVPRYSRKKYKLNLTASDPKCERLIIDALENRRSREDLPDSIYEFFQTCVSVVLAHGYAGYEIVYYSKEGGDIDSFKLALIPPSAFIVKRRKFRQYVPLEIANELKLKSQYVDFSPDDILLFELPEYVQPYHEKMMEALALLGQSFYPRWALQNLYKPKVPFSQSDFTLSREIALAKATRIIGWNARNYSNEHKFEHYVWHRQLVFYKFVCSLRETILTKLNEGLKRIGNKMSFNAELAIEGLPTAEDAELALQKLHQGDLKTFTEVLEKFR